MFKSCGQIHVSTAKLTRGEKCKHSSWFTSPVHTLQRHPSGDKDLRSRHKKRAKVQGVLRLANYRQQFLMFQKQTPVVTNCWDLYGHDLTLYLDEVSIRPQCIKQSEALGRLSGPALAAEQSILAPSTLGKEEAHTEWVRFCLSWPQISSTEKLKWLPILHLTFRREATDRQKPSKNVPSVQRLLAVPHPVFSPSRVIDFLARHMAI